MRICLDAGHGGSKPGAIFRGLKEKDVVLDIVLQTGDILKRLNYDVAYTRENDSDVDLYERCDVANFNKCDIFLSVHCNADPDEDEEGMPEAKGEEIWYYENSKESKKLAECLTDEINEFFPNEPFRGIKKSSGLIVLRYTNMPAVLIEVGFIDNSESNESFQSSQTISRIAELLAEGINDYLERRC